MNNSVEELYKFHKNVVLWVEEMILKNELRLRDVPGEIRRTSKLIYIAAFRASRSVSCFRFISDLQVLCEDIALLPDTDKKRKSELIALLSDTLQLSDYKGDERFEAFKKDMDEDVLRELHSYEYAHGKQLQAMLREYRTKNGIKGISKG